MLNGRGAADEPVHLVALAEQQLGEVGAVLAGDAGDECSTHSKLQSLGGRTPAILHQVRRAWSFGYPSMADPGQ